jgi:hydroxyethylthiazole kinase-like uncharacterized protein yjeF
MLKILFSNQIKDADAYTISKEPISSIDLMERAATACFEWLLKKFPDTKTNFILVCGLGNNGGDGLAISRLLLSKKYPVKTLIIGESEKMSADCKINYKRLSALKPKAISTYTSTLDLPLITKNTVIIEALFGTGLARKVEFPYTEIIKWINQSNATVVAIDVPGGMFTEPQSKDQNTIHVNANYTLTFQFPKLNFLLPDCGNAVGELVILDIGLHADFISEVETKNYFIEEADIKNILVKRPAFSHKGNFGHALIVAGSEGKMGAAVLSTHACLRSGCGLVSALVPEKGRAIIQTSLPEAMLFSTEEQLSSTSDLSTFTAIGVGPGLGTDAVTEKSLKLLIQNTQVPLVIDADAINLLANNKTWISFFRTEFILTPHVKEFERLTQKADNATHRLELAKEFCSKYGCYIVLKGKYSCLVCPDGNFYFNPSGNPGMAKGGSGDVLTGLLTGLVAQGYSAKNACLIGMYIHGLAGDIAATKFTETAMKAGDLLRCLPDAFKQTNKND